MVDEVKTEISIRRKGEYHPAVHCDNSLLSWPLVRLFTAIQTKNGKGEEKGGAFLRYLKQWPK